MLRNEYKTGGPEDIMILTNDQYSLRRFTRATYWYKLLSLKRHEIFIRGDPFYNGGGRSCPRCKDSAIPYINNPIVTHVMIMDWKLKTIWAAQCWLSENLAEEDGTEVAIIWQPSIALARVERWALTASVLCAVHQQDESTFRALRQLTNLIHNISYFIMIHLQAFCIYKWIYDDEQKQLHGVAE